MKRVPVLAISDVERPRKSPLWHISTTTIWTKARTMPAAAIVKMLMTKRCSGDVLATQEKLKTSMSKVNSEIQSRTCRMASGHSTCVNIAMIPNCWMMVTHMLSARASSRKEWPRCDVPFRSMYTYMAARNAIAPPLNTNKAIQPVPSPLQATQVPSDDFLVPITHSAHAIPSRPAAHISPGGPPTQRESSARHLKTDNESSAA
mmetsp:Transcript_102540/g.267605  ORF Transcript_102540/g.267605 Transcript_102540/m.267605 type:complete len:204 (+) Transcript_102540:137-748(+)